MLIALRWFVDDNRIAYEKNGSILYPTAEEIYLLNSGVYIDKFPEVRKLAGDELGIRFSRISAKIYLLLQFDEKDKNIRLSVRAEKIEKHACLSYKKQMLQDSVVIENVWYNLLANYEETLNLLIKSGINDDGKISLGQYILLKKMVRTEEKAELRDAAEKALSNHSVNDEYETMPVALKANLYPYQQQGYHWMQFVAKEHCGCILGDEMGLGKTLQVISLITSRISEGKGPSLIIAPVSLLENWRREFEKFTTGLNILVHHGSKRTGLYKDFYPYNVVVISYNTACSDQSLLKMIYWDVVVVDEAQNIKNPFANRTKSIKNIPRNVAIAVTGTPFENHISDLWSLMDFVAPGCFGKLSEFEEEFPDDINGAQALEPILSPIMIRRKVTDVAQDLPERVDVPQVLQMSQDEVLAYEQIRENILASFNGTNATLPMLQKLRMYCTHPLLINNQVSDNPILSSGKYERMCELLEEIVLLDEKAILFTSYNKMFDILQEDIPQRFGISVMTINGSTPAKERQLIVDEFSDITGSALLVLNPRAAGTGLNITEASRVIHYNLEWNPSLEDQATARAYRKGQDKTVFVYRLYYRGTVEEIMNERISKKRDMFSAAVVGTDGNLKNYEDIVRALMISPGGTKDGK